MKKNLYLLMMVLMVSHTSFSQSEEDESKYALVASDSTVIISEKYHIVLKGVISNPYNDKYSSNGLGLVEYAGYSLAETLTQLARKANHAVKINNLPNNPKICVKILFPSDDLHAHFPDILTELSKYYQFTVSKSEIERTIHLLTIEDSKKFVQHINQKSEPGVLQSSKVKGDRIELTNHNLATVSSWLAGKLAIDVQPAPSDRKDVRIDLAFNASSKETILSELETKYGLVLLERRVKSSGFVLN